MDHFEGAKTVRLRGAHGSYLWAEHDQYGVSQMSEDKNEQALWYVERSKPGSKSKTLWLKSCFDAYLAASENHYHGIAFLTFSGKRVTQMRPENVESTTIFDWEPVIEQGRLKLKSCYGTYLRANAHGPPWNNSVSHDLPQHQSHQEWLVWDVEKVHVPNVVPLELVIGRIDRMEKEQPSLREKSKIPGVGTARKVAESDPHPVQERSRNQGVVATVRSGESEQHRVDERSQNPVVGTVSRADEAELQPLQERLRNPGVGTARRTADSERHPVYDRYENPGVGRPRRADESERHPVQERFRNLDVGTARRVEGSNVGTARRPDESERYLLQEKSRIPGVSNARRAD